ncbi:MAG: hypothetical protein AMXMBFR84_50190 [Candidatus Hydrogenedentota bacterium]
MNDYFAYIRVSTVRQGERGVSLTEQRDAIARYATANSLNIRDWFEERETAAKSGRPVFSKMLEQLKRGLAKGIVIHKIDRSSRNLRDWANLGELLDSGVDVRFAHEGLDLNSRGGRLSADIQAVVAADYIRNLREETRKGFYGRLKQGLYPLAAPLGYKDNGAGKPKSICPINGPIVRSGFEAYATGLYSLDRLTEELYEWGLRTRYGGKLTLGAVAELLKNPFYIGQIRIRSTNEIFAGLHEPLINTSLFKHVQAVFEGRMPKRTRTHEFLFRQIFTCKACGCYLIGEYQKGHVYYRCHSRRCRMTCIRENLLEDATAASLSRIKLTTEEIANLKDVANEAQAEFTKNRQKVLASLELKKTAINGRLDRLLDAYLDQCISKADYEHRKKSVLLDISLIEERLRNLHSDSTHEEKITMELLELLKTLDLSHKTGKISDSRELLRTIYSNRVVLGKNVELEPNIPFRELSNRPILTNCCPFGDTSRTWWKEFLKRHIARTMGDISKNDSPSEPKSDKKPRGRPRLN